METTTTNSRPQRKTLASQLDRLDLILDTLDEGLQGAVAMAVQEAIGKAVQAAVTEVLTNAELQQRLHAGFVNQTNTGPSKLKSLWQGVKCGLHRGWTVLRPLLSTALDFVHRSLHTTRSRAKEVFQPAKAIVRGAWMRMLLALTLARRLRKPLIAALGVGTTIGLGCYFAGPVVASCVSGVAGFTGSLTASAFNALRRMMNAEFEDG
jgi:hypothetical protein